MTGIEHLPLCDGGRCASIMAAFSQVKERAVENQGNVLAQVLRGVLADLGVNADDAAVRAAIVRNIQAMTAESGGAQT